MCSKLSPSVRRVLFHSHTLSSPFPFHLHGLRGSCESLEILFPHTQTEIISIGKGLFKSSTSEVSHEIFLLRGGFWMFLLLAALPIFDTRILEISNAAKIPMRSPTFSTVFLKSKSENFRNFQKFEKFEILGRESKI